MPSRTYAITSVTPEQGITPIAADNLVLPLRFADDEKFLRVNLASSVTQGVNILRISYDEAIPTGSTIDTISVTVRYSQNFASTQFSTFAVVGMGVGHIASMPLPEPQSPVEGVDPPKPDNWATATEALEPIIGQWDVLLLGDLEVDLLYTWNNLKAISPFQYVDYVSLTINFTLAPPVNAIFPAEAENVARNSFLATTRCLFDPTSFNSSYPVYTFFQYCEVDPTNPVADARGQFEIFETERVLFSPPLNGVARFSAVIPAGFNPYIPNKVLLPNKEYWFRGAAENEVETVYGASWVSTTTLTFDATLEY